MKYLNIQALLGRKQFDKDVEKLSKEKVNINVNASVSGNQDIKNTRKSLTELNHEGKESSKVFSSARQKMTMYLTTLGAVAQAVKGSVKSIREFDSSVTDLANAMGRGREEAAKYLATLNKQGQELGAITKEMSDASDSWLRQGKSVAETEKLVKDSMVLSKVGKLESAEATEYLTSALNGYKLEAESAIGIIDKLTSVDLVTASDAGGLALSMSRTASAANMASVSMDKLIAMIATVKETTQDSDESVGNMFKSVFSRMNQIRAGKYVDLETGEPLNDVEKVLNKVGIAMRDTNNQFISSEKIMDEVGQRWSAFDDATKRAVATAMAGTYQYNKLISLFENWSNVLKYSEVAQNSSGSSMKKFENYEESLEAKTKSLQASLESLAYDTFGTDFYGNVLDATRALVNFTEESNLLKTGLAVGGSLGMAKLFTEISTEIVSVTKQLSNFSTAMDVSKSAEHLAYEFDSLLGLTKGLTDAQTRLVLSSKLLSDEQRINIMTNRGMSVEEAKATLATYGLSVAEDKATVSTLSLGNAVRGLGLKLKAFVAANPFIAGITLITAATFGAIKASDAWLNRAKNNATDSAEAYNETKEEIENINSELESNGKRIDELNAKENLTLLEAEELERLKESNREMENTLALKEKLAQKEKETANKDAVEYFTEDSGIYNKESGTYDATHIQAATQDLEYLYSLEEQIQEKKNELAKEKPGTYKYKEISNELDGLNKSYDIMLGKVQESYDTFSTLDDNLFEGKDDEILSQLDAFYNRFGEVITGVAQTHTDAISGALGKEMFSGVEEQLTALAKDGSLSIETLTSKFPSLIEFLDESGVSAQELLQYIEALANPDAVNIDNMKQTMRNDYQSQYTNHDDKVYAGQDYDRWIADKSDEEVQILYDIKHDGTSTEGWSFEDFDAEIEKRQNKELVVDAEVSISSTVDHLKTQITPVLDELKSAYQDIFTTDDKGKEIFNLDNVDISMLDDLKSSIEEVNEAGMSIDSSVYDEFVNTLTDSTSTAEDVHNAFNNMASGICDGLTAVTTENYNVVSSILESVGVVNAQEVAFQALVSNTEALEEAGLNLAEAEYEDMKAFVDSAVSAEYAGEALDLLQLKKILINTTQITAASDIQQILGLAEAANISSQALVELANAKSQFETASANGDKRGMSLAARGIKDAGAEFKAEMENFTMPEIKFDGNTGSGIKDKASKAAKKEKDAWLEAYKKELAELEHLREMEQISDLDFYNGLSAINEKYFNDSAEHHEKYLDEYRDNEEKIFKGLKQIREDALSSEKSSLDSVLDYMSSQSDKTIDAYKDKMESITDEYERQKDAAIDAIDAEIDALDDKMDALDDLIDAKQDEIKAIRDAEKALERQKNLEDALYKQRQAQNQKSGVYQTVDEHGGQKVYKANDKAITEANDAVNKAQNENRIAEIEKEIEALEKEKDNLKDLQDEYEKKKEKTEEYYDSLIASTEEYYNTLIDGQEKIKSRYEELKGIQEEAEMQAKLEELGLLQEGVADMSDEAFQKLKLNYMAVLKDMNDGNAEILNKLSELSGVDMSSLMGYLAQSQTMLAGIAGVNISPVNESLGTIPENAVTATSSVNDTVEEAKQQVASVKQSFDNLSSDVASYQLPALNTEQFTASLGTADGTSGVLGQLNTFVARYKEICDTIPQVWRDTMSIISGTQGSVGGEGTDYNSLFEPMLIAMDNAKFQIDEKLKSYADAWTTFNTDLGGIIGVSGGEGGEGKGKDGKGKLAPAAKAFGGDTGKKGEGKGAEGGTDTIVGSIQTGGQIISETFDNQWIPSFKSMGQNINDICGKVVLSVNEMAESTVSACQAAIDAINMLNAAKASSSADNPTPSDFKGSAYVGQTFASGTDGLPRDEKNALVSEYGQQELTVFPNGKHLLTGVPTILDLPKGSVVYNEKQTKKILDDSKSVGNSFANGTLTPVSESIRWKPEIIEQFMKGVTLPIQNFTPQKIDYSVIPKGGNSNVTQNINVNIPNITNETGFNNFKKEIEGMKLDALQMGYKR